MAVTRLTGKEIADGTVLVADLSTTGTPSASTVLYGDGVWRTLSSAVDGSTIINVDQTNPNATNTRTGISKYSLDKPFLTVQAAFSVAVGGDVINIYGGYYNETISASHPSVTVTLQFHSSVINGLTATANNATYVLKGIGAAQI